MIADTSAGSGKSSQIEVLEGRRLLSVAVHAELHRPQTAVADFNGDGKADLVVAVAERGGGGGGSGGSVYLRVMANNGDLSFTRTSEIRLGDLRAGTSQVKLAVGDLDRDGDVDLAYAIFGEAGAMRVGTLVGDGKGGLTPAGESTARMAINKKGTGAAGFAAGDLDGDGRADLVAWTNDEIAVFAGDGKGGMGDARKGVNPLYESSGNSGSNPLHQSRIAGAADLDGDGRAELIGFDRSGIRTATLKSMEPLAFGLDKPVALPDLPTDDLLIGDVDGDGAPDLVVISGGRVQFGLNAGGKSDVGPIRWMPPESLRLSPDGVTIADLDGDGRDDLFTMVSNVLKTKHDTVKNSINNVR